MDMEWLRGKCIGRGAFGTVHLAVDRATGRAFAVKSVDVRTAPAAALACLESEISILKRLRSPYVVAYLGDGATGSRRDLHMELVPGGTVAEAAARRRGLGERAASGVLRRVAAALRYLHDDAGVVHGDVKGRNVLLGRDDAGGCDAKLADFGAATSVIVSGGAAVPPPRGPRGTPAWMAPEVARGGAATPASDVWSLGCTALELLTGNRPWAELGAASGVSELLFLVGFGGKERPAVPARLSDSCRDFLDKCLRRDATQRWSCDQLLRHPFLSLSLSSASTHDDDAGEPSPSPSPSPRAVLDWAMSDTDSDSEALLDDAEHEVMARVKARLAELASDRPRASWEKLDDWGTGSTTWAADTWLPQPVSEAPMSLTSNSGVGNDAHAGWPASIAPSAAGRDQVVGTSTSGALPCVHDRPSCHCRRYVYGFGVGWPPLAVVPGLMPYHYCFPVDSVQSDYYVPNQASVDFRMPFLLISSLISTETAADF